MRVSVNDEIMDVPPGISVGALLSLLEIQSFAGMALAINNEVVSRNDWETTSLSENDKVLIIRATKGG